MFSGCFGSLLTVAEAGFPLFGVLEEEASEESQLPLLISRCGGSLVVN